MSQVIVVFGATGTQGGSVLRALLKDKRNFTVRAVTRNTESPKAKALAALGKFRNILTNQKHSSIHWM